MRLRIFVRHFHRCCCCRRGRLRCGVGLVQPLLHDAIVVLALVRGEELGEEIRLAPVLEPEVLEEVVEIGDLVEHNVREEAAVAVGGAVARVPAQQGGVVEDGRRVDGVVVEAVVEIRVGPETLQLAARRVGEVREHADKHQRAVAALRGAGRRDAPVQPEGGVVGLRVEARVERLHDLRARRGERAGDEARESLPDRRVRFGVEGLPEFCLRGSVRRRRDPEVRVARGRRELQSRFG